MKAFDERLEKGVLHLMNENTISGLFSTKDNLHKYDGVGSVMFGQRIPKAEVSIMIPTYKRPKLLRKAIKSAISQDGITDYEVVVVDNDPNTLDEDINELLTSVDDSRLSYYRNEDNIGMFGNWNMCISLARGDWLIILNDDDELCTNYLSSVVNYARSLPNCGAIACQHVLIDENENTIGEDQIKIRGGRNKVIDIKMKDFYFFHPTNIYGCLINKKVAECIGGFDEELWPCSDAAFLINVCDRYKLYLCTDVVFKYRWAVNESQKPETRIDFCRFNLLKAMTLNRKYYFFNEKLDLFIRDCMCDYDVFWFLKEGLLESNDIKSFKAEMNCSEKTYHARSYLARLINRLYRTTFRNRIYHNK